MKPIPKTPEGINREMNGIKHFLRKLDDLSPKDDPKWQRAMREYFIHRINILQKALDGKIPTPEKKPCRRRKSRSRS